LFLPEFYTTYSQSTRRLGSHTVSEYLRVDDSRLERFLRRFLKAGILIPPNNPHLSNLFHHKVFGSKAISSITFSPLSRQTRRTIVLQSEQIILTYRILKTTKHVPAAKMCKYITQNYACGCFYAVRHIITCLGNRSKSALKCEVVEIIVKTKDRYCWPCYLKGGLRGTEG